MRGLARVLGLIIFALSFFVLAQPARASTCASYDFAMQQCAMEKAKHVSGTCTWNAAQSRVVLNFCDCCGCSSTFWDVSCPPDFTPPNGCEDLPLKTFQGGLSSVCVSGCSYAPALDLGGTSHQRINMDGSISEVFGGAYRSTGQTCSGGPTADPPVSDPTPERKLCGGGSCHDVAAGKFCAVNGAGVQVCVSDKPPSSGACVTGGDTTLCAGNPAPLPPMPPVIEPASQLKATDKYADTTGGVTTNNTVNNYNTSGGSPNSGAGVDDSVPAPPSSSGGAGDGTGSFGGGDCNTPPVVTGSPALAAVAYQTWATRCAIAGAGAGQSTGTLDGLYTKSTDTVGSVVGEFQTSVKDSPFGTTAANFFALGPVGGQCPVWTVPESDYLPAMTMDFYCAPELADLLDLAKWILIIGCAYAAWRIAMGDS